MFIFFAFFLLVLAGGLVGWSGCDPDTRASVNAEKGSRETCKGLRGVRESGNRIRAFLFGFCSSTSGGLQRLGGWLMEGDSCTKRGST